MGRLPLDEFVAERFAMLSVAIKDLADVVRARERGREKKGSTIASDWPMRRVAA
jgi:hypothetical protein